VAFVPLSGSGGRFDGAGTKDEFSLVVVRPFLLVLGLLGLVFSASPLPVPPGAVSMSVTS
jgi:hypothetical protein